MTKYDLCTGDIVLSTKGSYGIVLIGIPLTEMLL